jgi:hypothetical protein
MHMSLDVAAQDDIVGFCFMAHLGTGSVQLALHSDVLVRLCWVEKFFVSVLQCAVVPLLCEL